MLARYIKGSFLKPHSTQQATSPWIILVRYTKSSALNTQYTACHQPLNYLGQIHQGLCPQHTIHKRPHALKSTWSDTTRALPPTHNTQHVTSPWIILVRYTKGSAPNTQYTSGHQRLDNISQIHQGLFPRHRVHSKPPALEYLSQIHHVFCPQHSVHNKLLLSYPSLA